MIYTDIYFVQKTEGSAKYNLNISILKKTQGKQLVADR